MLESIWLLISDIAKCCRASGFCQITIVKEAQHLGFAGRNYELPSNIGHLPNRNSRMPGSIWLLSHNPRESSTATEFSGQQL